MRGALRDRGWHRLLVLVVLAVFPVLGACGAESERLEEVRDAEPAAAPEDSAPESPESRMLLALEGEGLRLVDATTGSTRPVAFGSDEEMVHEVLTAALGGGPVERGEAVDCALAYSRWDPGLTTYFADGAFVGWGVRDADALTTMSGIGLGSSRAELESAYAVDIAPSTLGLEFHAGRLAGLLEGEDAHSRVTHLWAGHTCIAR